MLRKSLRRAVLCTAAPPSARYVTPELRKEVRTAAAQMHELYRRGHTPQVRPTKACSACSLKELCLPRLQKSGPVGAYLRENMEEPP